LPELLNHDEDAYDEEVDDVGSVLDIDEVDWSQV